MKTFNVFKGWIAGLVLAGSLSLFLGSCGSGEDDIASTTPKEALLNFASNNDCHMIVSIRIGDLINKSGVKEDLLPEEMKMLVKPYMDQFLDADETGIDVNGTSYMTMNMKGIPEMPELVAFFVPLSDAEKFASFLESKSHMSPESGEGYKFVALPNGTGAVAWNNGMAVVMGGGKFKGGSAEKLAELMKTMTEEGKGSNKVLAKFVDKKADLGMYMDYEKYMEVLKDMPGMDVKMFNNDVLKSFSKDAFVTGYLNFENGKISLETEMSGNKDFKDLMANMYSNGKPEYANYLGGDDLIGFMTLSMNIDQILSMYEKSGFFETPEVSNGLAEMKEKTGLSIRDLANKFTGDFSIALVDIVESEEEAEAPVDDNPYAGYYEDNKNTQPVITMAIGINDSLMSSAFDTISELKKKGNVYKFEGMGGLCLKNNILFISTDEALLDDFALDGRLNTYSKNNAEKSIGENCIYGYFDFKSFADLMTNVDPEVAAAVAALDYAELKMNKDAATFSGILHMNDKGENSLKSLVKMLINASNASNAMF